MRGSVVLAVVLLGALAREAAPAPAPRPENVRRDLDALQRAVEGAVARVAPPVAGFFGVTPVRAYRVQGVGILVVLPARVLPSVQNRAAVDPQVVRALDEAMRGLQESLKIADSPEARRQLKQSLDSLRLTKVKFMRTKKARPVERGVPREIEAHLQQMQAEAEAFRQQAEEARQEAERELQQQYPQYFTLHPSAPPPGVPPAPAAPQAPLAPRPPAPGLLPLPPAPWELWFSIEGEEAETRTADELVQEVKTAVMTSLGTHPGPWDTLSAEETVSVAIDFLPRRGGPAPRTVALRAKASDLAARVKGRMSQEELVRRIHAAEY
jgi:hypothetical protein